MFYRLLCTNLAAFLVYAANVVHNSAKCFSTFDIRSCTNLASCSLMNRSNYSTDPAPIETARNIVVLKKQKCLPDAGLRSGT